MRGEVRAGRREGVGCGVVAAQAGVHGEGPTQGWGARARAERTQNMRYMFVTLEVSKLSGWLNFRADCRVEREKHAMRGEVRAGRREGVERWHRERHARARSDSRLLGARARAERTKNM